MNLPYKILFFCNGNSARSILAEHIIRKVDPKRFESFSAGANPTGKVNPFVIQFLQDTYSVDTSGARSKSWEEYDKMHFDFVITLCDRTKENCPLWKGQPIIAHWPFEDPAKFSGTPEEQLRAISILAMQINRRISQFCSFPIETMERLRLEYAAQNIIKEN